jgi:hypothetical protein
LKLPPACTVLDTDPGRGDRAGFAGAIPAGFAIQAVGLLQSHALPRGESVLFLIGVLFVGPPDGLEIINLGASLLMAVAMVPYGIRLIAAAL